jgi:NADPH:quinone reductase-like Zn-dependent oxidoreductase
MKKVVLPAYNKNIVKAIRSLQVDECRRLEPGNDEVLIRVHAAPCNPSDIAFLMGGYNIIKKVPAVPGFEGSGVVVEAGEGAEDLIDRKVSFFIQEEDCGSWSEYVVSNRKKLVVLDEAMDMDQAACFAINPFTARGLLDIALLRDNHAIIQNAAGGQVAAFVRQMATDMGIQVIDIVRKERTVTRLKKEGARHVLLESDPDFEQKLKKLATALDARLAFDAVGGSLAGQIFNAMPPDAELVAYGGLSTKPVSGIDSMDLIFRDKIISGFNLPEWREQMDDDFFEQVSQEMQHLFISGKFKTKIQGSIDFDNISDGLIHCLRNLSKGKMLIKSALSE